MMNWRQLLSTQRFKIKDGEVQTTSTPSTLEGVDALRTDFHIDYDRVVFSGSFRSLGRKTQVHPFAKDDHTHNRLTHSIEVASVGRSIGNRVGIMLQSGEHLSKKIAASTIGSVIQVACLAHDLGNPPFGHTGEYAIRDWFLEESHQKYLSALSDVERQDIVTYEGNAHSLRVVSHLEMYRGRGGMRLTAASLGTLLKYPWSSSAPLGKHKFNIYQTEMPLIHRVAQELGLPQKGDAQWARHPLSYLMEAADDICYALLDLEDAVESNLLHEHDIEMVLSPLTSVENAWQAPSKRQRCAMMRGIAIGRAIDDVAHTFMRNHQALLAGELPAHDILSLCHPDVRDTLEAAKSLARERIFKHESKLITELAAYPCIGSILNLLIPAAQAYVESGQINHKQSLALNLMQDEPLEKTDTLYMAYMKVLDFVGGMTDNAAAQLAREVSGIGMV